MNILYVVPAMYPYGWAYATRARSLAKLIQEAGHDVTVMSDYLSDIVEWKGNNIAEYDGIRITTTSDKKASERTIGDKLLVRKRIHTSINEYVKREKVECIVTAQTHQKFGSVYKCAKQNGIPLILETCEWFSYKNWKLGFLDPRFLSFQYCWNIRFRNVKKAICISRLLENRFNSLGAQTVRIPTILNVEEYRFKDSSILHSPIKLLFIGGITGGKDELAGIIETICQYEMPFELFIYGPRKNDGEATISPKIIKTTYYKNNIHFCGHIDQQVLQSKIIECDYGIIIRPNRRSSNAGFPTKLGEYFVAGLPVIANDTGDIGMYVKTGETGILFKGNKKEEILYALKYIENVDASQYQMMSQKCRNSAYTDFNYKSYITAFKRFVEI